MIKTVEMHKVICDRCGVDAFDDSEYSCWQGADLAAEMAEADDWKTIGDKHYCYGCLVWNEDEDDLIPNPEPKTQEATDER